MLKLIFSSPLGLILLVALAYALYNPAVIPDQKIREQVTKTRDELIANNPEAGKNVLGAMTATKDTVMRLVQNTKLPPELTGEKKEIVVDEYVTLLGEQLKQLPSEQLKRVKVSFCQDVIDEATKSGVMKN